MPTPQQTRLSLLERLRDSGDSDAWAVFYRHYSPLICSFTRKRGCSEQLSNDILQESMVTLMRALPRFQYDPKKGKFRSFLLKIVHNNMVNAFRREQKYSTVEIEEGPLQRAAQENPITPHDDLEAAWDQEWEKHLLSLALERVRDRLNERTWRGFKMYVLENQSVEKVCKELGLNANALYQHRNRVIRMLKEEVRMVRAELGDHDD